MWGWQGGAEGRVCLMVMMRMEGSREGVESETEAGRRNEKEEEEAEGVRITCILTLLYIWYHGAGRSFQAHLECI